VGAIVEITQPFDQGQAEIVSAYESSVKSSLFQQLYEMVHFAAPPVEQVGQLGETHPLHVEA